MFVVILGGIIVMYVLEIFGWDFLFFRILNDGFIKVYVVFWDLWEKLGIFFNMMFYFCLLFLLVVFLFMFVLSEWRDVL